MRSDHALGRLQEYPWSTDVLKRAEAPVGIEPTVGDLQSPALPLGDGAMPQRNADAQSTCPSLGSVAKPPPNLAPS